MYGAFPDPYCYPGTDVLRNRLGIRDPVELGAFETASTLQRAAEPLPAGRFSATHYRAIHHHFFRDVYRWAGRYRTVVLAKGGSVFCLPENIEAQMTSLFSGLKRDRFLRGLSHQAFAREGARFLATLNAIHPFREGNGRSQLSFLVALSDAAGHPIALDRLAPQAFLEAMVESFHGREVNLQRQLRDLCG